MKTTHTKTLLATLTTLALWIQPATASLIVSTIFDVDPASTSIDTTGADVVDWGYFLPNADFLDGTQAASTNFDALTAGNGTINPATNSKASPGIGIVTITERGAGEYTNGDTGKAWSFTVNDGINPVSGTQSPLGAVNGIATSEDIFNITFNDLPVGPSTITLYMDHTSNNRRFDATVDLFASDGNEATAIQSNTIGGSDGEGHFTFAVEVSSLVAGSDLSISIDSAGSGTGQFQFAGYTVTAVPEPSTLALVLLGAACLKRLRS